MLDFVTAAWLGLIGACVGSFLNVVAYRLPRGMSVVWKPSHCPQCGHDIRWYDNVPVAGWLLLGGRCRDCGGAISPRYAIVEAIVGLAYFALAYVDLFTGGDALSTVWNPNWPLIGRYAYDCALFSGLACATLIGLDRSITRQRLVSTIVLLAALFALRLAL